MRLHIDGAWFKDEHDRTVHLRGVNLGGSNKVPVQPPGATHIRDGFFEHENVSFVGRPFPLEDADEHFARLRHWGMRLIRLPITWEAIEHAGPGIYDEAFLDYITAIVAKAGEYDMKVFIDAHQDVWSRFSGGDGAPGWTLERVGLDMRTFHLNGAALTHQMHGDPFPRMIWASNYSKLAASTMFTLFFAGNDFAPQTMIDDIPVQEFLQTHYINAFKQVALRVRDMPHVMGYDAINEPFHGFIGVQDLNGLHSNIRIGAMPTPIQSMALGHGITQEVADWQITPLGPQQMGSIRVVPPKEVCAWKKGFDDIWMQHGVWGVDLDGQPRLLLPDYFSRREGKVVDFSQDYLRPFINRFGEGIRDVHPEALIFIEGEAEHTVQSFRWTDEDIDNIVYAAHWYDGLTLLLKRYFSFLGFDVHTLRPVIGSANIDKSFARQMTVIRNYARQYLNEAPTVIGETGIPFDLNNKLAYLTGNYHAQEQAMNRTMKALEASRVNFTLWNYTADNSHEHGDLWNGEDLSIFSPDDRDNPADINSGGRALKTVIRPYARASAGRPLRYSYDIETGCFEYVFRHDDHMTEPTDFYIPAYQYPHGYRVQISDGRYEMHPETQTLLYYHTERDIPHFIRVMPNPPRKPERSTFETFWLPRLLSAGGVLLVLWVYLNRNNNHDEETIENSDE